MASVLFSPLYVFCFVTHFWSISMFPPLVRVFLWFSFLLFLPFVLDYCFLELCNFSFFLTKKAGAGIALRQLILIIYYYSLKRPVDIKRYKYMHIMLHKGWWGTNKHDLWPGDWGQSLLVKGQNHLVKKKKKRFIVILFFSNTTRS